MFGTLILSNPISGDVEGTRRRLNLFLVFALISSLLVVPFVTAAAASAPVGGGGAVFTMTNAAAGNEVIAFDRSSDGTLVMAGAYETGGLGTGAGLGSQGAVMLSDNHQWLLAVNAGSNEISVFAVSGNSLMLTNKVSSGGIMPISVDIYKNLVYVLNAGGSGNITGFKLDHLGRLHPLRDSTRNLSNGGAGDSPGPAQISFTPTGSALVVTEKATNLIDIYRLEKRGFQGPYVFPSPGQTPFGFEFGKRNTLIVSEAFGGMPDLSTLSSYRVSHQNLDLISASVPTHQTAACWVVVTRNGKYAYTTNTGSSSISGYLVNPDGHLTLLDEDGVTASTGEGSSPIDMALSINSQFLYAVSRGTEAISGFEVHADGSLTPISMTSVPAGSLGLAGY